MLIKGRDKIKAPRDEVWKFLTNAEAVGHCTPGLESMEIVEPGKKFQALGTIGMGTVKVKFTATIEWTELKEPTHAKMKMQGTAPGSSIDVASELDLIELGVSATELEWQADVNIVGSIASLANRLMKPVTQKMTSQFFTCIRKQIEA